MPKRLVSILIIICLSVALYGCSKTDEGTTSSASEEVVVNATRDKLFSEDDVDGSGLTIGFIGKSSHGEYWELVKRGVESAANHYGCEYAYIAPENDYDAAAQAGNLDSLISMGADAICISPVDDAYLSGMYEQASARGVKLIAVDTDSAYEQKLSFIGADEAQASCDGGRFAGGEAGQGARAIILRGRTGDAVHDVRQEGIEIGLREKAVQVLEVIPVESNEEAAMQATLSALSAHGQLELIVTTSDAMALGAYNALKQMGNESTLVYGYEGTPSVAKLIMDKTQLIGSTALNPYNIGIIGVQNALHAILGHKIEDRINTGYTVINRDNVAEYVAKLDSFKAN